MLQNTPKRHKSKLFCPCVTSSNVALALRPNPETLASMLRRARLPCVFISVWLILTALVAPPAQADQTPAAASTLTDLLTHEEFVQSGLQKLSPKELATLEMALIRHQQLAGSAAAHSTPVDSVSSIGTSVVSPASSAFGSEQVVKGAPAETAAELHSHIEGSLDGFAGRAVFVLENGQIWQQRVPETVYFARKLVNPEVVLTRSFAGYKMLIVPADRVVFVKRIQ
jgi:hypothetical protein